MIGNKIKIKFSTKYAEGSGGHCMHLIGEQNGIKAIREYRITGLFQGYSIRRARRQIIEELKNTQPIFYPDTNQK